MSFFKSKKQSPEPDNVIPEAKANILSRITFWWAGNLMYLGYKRPLEKEDLYVMNDKRLAENLMKKFDAAWKKEVNKKNPSLWRALYGTVGRKFLFAGICRICGDSLQVTSPLLIQKILIFLATSYYTHQSNVPSPGSKDGYVYIVGLFLMQVGYSLFNNTFFYKSMEAGLLTRTTLISAIYQKAMVLSGKARTIFTIGKVTNLMSTDTSRLDLAAGYAHIMWAAPLETFVALGLLIRNLGPSALAGFALLIVMGPVQGKVMKTLQKGRAKALKITDERVKLTQEILQGIRVIKYYAWEESFLEALSNLRTKEVNYVRFLLIIRSWIMGASMVVPVFASMLSFVVYSLRGGVLSAEIVFSSVALFNIIRLPLMLLPMVVALFTDALVSARRIKEFLLAEELESLPKITYDSECAVRIENGEFLWESAPPEEKKKSKKELRREKKLMKRQKKNGQDKNEKSSNNHENEKKYLEEINPIEKSEDGKSETSATLTPADSAARLENVQQLKPLSHLRNINIFIPRGALVAVVGSVGSGKTSLLSALVGEMKKVSGDIEFGGSVGYCPQTAWIQNATLRENVLFGLPFDEERYRQVIRDCCLEPDLAILPSEDLTEIGEKGINLSGGQKQRVNIARAVYYNADIVLLDDPLSAVDAHVGKALFENCICGTLKSKTRILVTHKLGILQDADYVIYMEDGEITEQGTYEELIKAGKSFSKLIAEYGEGDEEEEEEEDDDDDAEAEKIVDDSKKEDKKKVAVAGKGLMTTEERSTGAVDNMVYISYLKSAGSLFLVPVIFFMLVGMQGSSIGNNLWLSYWSSNRFDLSTGEYIGIYCIWGVSSAIFSLVSGLVFSVSGVKAAKKLHDRAVRRVLRAPTSFFDTTPLGRIINRFSKDVDTCDNLLSESYRMFLNTLGVVIGTFILISVIFPWFLLPLAPLVVFYYIAAAFYRSTNRELKRLDSILRSSLYAHFSESLTGLPTIRAYREQVRFIRNNEKFTDLENRAYFLTICVQRWLGLRLDAIANLLIFFASLFSVIQRFDVNPSISGVVLSYALAVTGTFNWCIRQAAEVEANMNAVERLVYYSEELDMEAELVLPDNRPPPEWPTKGEVHIKDLVIQYGPKNPPVLHGISVDIQPAEKIGIVGRTGCGKSTLATSFFRFVEPTSGKIEIDGIDINTIGLKDLRSKITIIPQEPVLFNGTLRSNIDPFNEHDDLSLWDALKGANLVHESQPIASAQPSSVDPEKAVPVISESTTTDATQQRQELTLDAPVDENGSNFSQGQRQLITLARALVRHSKLIILDEATASVDFKTDFLIQTTIREGFKDSTVITIAHRLRTVADYDRILVMDAGNIIEFDAPYTLMQNPDSAFRKMCEQSGEFLELMEIARQKFEDGVYREISKK